MSAQAVPSSPGFTTLAASRHAKYASRLSQHRWRSFLEVALGVSDELLLENQPMVEECVQELWRTSAEGRESFYGISADNYKDALPRLDSLRPFLGISLEMRASNTLSFSRRSSNDRHLHHNRLFRRRPRRLRRLLWTTSSLHATLTCDTLLPLWPRALPKRHPLIHIRSRRRRCRLEAAGRAASQARTVLGLGSTTSRSRRNLIVPQKNKRGTRTRTGTGAFVGTAKVAVGE